MIIYLKQIIPFCCIFLISFQNSPTITLTLSCTEKSIQTNKLKITLKSQKDISIKLPSQRSLRFGYKDDNDAECFFEVYELKNEKEWVVQPTADYDYFPAGNKTYIYLKLDHPVSYEFNITDFYSFKK